MDIHKVRFCFSDGWKAPLIPILGKDQAFIDARNIEIDECFGEVEIKLSNINAASEVGYRDLLIAQHVIKELMKYRSTLNPEKLVNSVVKAKAYVPYTASNKKRLGLGGR